MTIRTDHQMVEFGHVAQQDLRSIALLDHRVDGDSIRDGSDVDNVV